MTRRDRILLVVALLGFIASWVWKAEGRVSFVEGAILLIAFVAVVAVVAIILERVRRT